MVIVGPGVGVATKAIEDGKIGRIGMAFGTLIPLVFVVAAIDREIHSIMVKTGRNPDRLVVAILTSGREPCRGMVRVIGLGIFRLVTTVAGCRHIVVIVVDVTGVTIE